MTRYEYKVVPAPRKAGKVKGVKSTEARFAHDLSQLMNDYGADGWEYQRTDTLPCEERSGLTGRTTNFQNMLVFRRELGVAMAPAPVPQPAPRALDVPRTAEVPSADAISSIHSAAPAPDPRPGPQPDVEPRRVPSRPVAVEHAVPEPVPAPVPDPDYEEAREEVATLPAFRSAKSTETPTFTSRSAEGRIPRLGAARRGDGATPGPTLVKR